MQFPIPCEVECVKSLRRPQWTWLLKPTADRSRISRSASWATWVRLLRHSRIQHIWRWRMRSWDKFGVLFTVTLDGLRAGTFEISCVNFFSHVVFVSWCRVVFRWCRVVFRDGLRAVVLEIPCFKSFSLRNSICEFLFSQKFHVWIPFLSEIPCVNSFSLRNSMCEFLFSHFVFVVA